MHRDLISPSLRILARRAGWMLLLVPGLLLASCGGNRDSVTDPPPANGNGNGNGDGNGDGNDNDYFLGAMSASSFHPSSVPITVGEFEHAFESTGTFPYECTFHEGMTGQIVVSEE